MNKATTYTLLRRSGIQAVGGDGSAGDFFVVMTLLKGDPPPVRILEGTGLQVKAAVGGRAVSFDGEKVVLRD